MSDIILIVVLSRQSKRCCVDQNWDRMPLLEGVVGSQATKLKELPSELDEMVAMIGTDHGGTLENPLS
jgi:hypothetical protein